MAEIKEFVVNDRRKFTAEGDIRPDAPPSEPKPPRPETLHPAEDSSSAKMVNPASGEAKRGESTTGEAKGPQAVPPQQKPEASSAADTESSSDQLPPPTAEQSNQAKRAFDATVDRLDTAIRATNPGMERVPELTFERLIQSLYMQAMMQLGGAAAPGQQPQVDILGARQTIDMLGIFSAKTKGNLTPAEATLLDTALFELHMGFLEVTQALSRQAAARPQGGPGGAPPMGGPSIVR
jgi:hypothetical protein